MILGVRYEEAVKSRRRRRAVVEAVVARADALTEGRRIPVGRPQDIAGAGASVGTDGGRRAIFQEPGERGGRPGEGSLRSQVRPWLGS